MLQKMVYKLMGGPFVAACLFVPTAAFSADTVPNTSRIVQVLTYRDVAAIQISPAYENNIGCAGNNANSWVIIDWASNSNAKNLYAAVLVAQATGNPVGFGINNCYANWGGGTPIVYRVDAPTP